MHRPEFSESQFEFECLSELRDDAFSNGFSSFIWMPTQRDERKVGYDAFFDERSSSCPGRPFFLQFKTSCFFDGKRSPHRKAMGEDYFGFKIDNTKAPSQHALLVELANIFGDNVFYVAPDCWQWTDFWLESGKNTAFVNSALLNCRDIGKLSGNNHKECYSVSPSGTISSRTFSEERPPFLSRTREKYQSPLDFVLRGDRKEYKAFAEFLNDLNRINQEFYEKPKVPFESDGGMTKLKNIIKKEIVFIWVKTK